MICGGVKLGSLHDNDWQAIADAKITGISLPLAARPTEGLDVIRSIVVNPETISGQPVKDAIAKAVDCKRFVIYRYPNRTKNGFGYLWENGGKFARWFIRVYDELKTDFPDREFGFPMLDNGEFVDGIRGNSEVFFQEATDAVVCADFLFEEVRMKDNRFGNDFCGGIYRLAHRKTTCKMPIYVEFGNESTVIRKVIKALQVVDFYRESAKIGVDGAYCRYLSSGNKALQWMTWCNEIKVTPIPLIVGGR